MADRAPRSPSAGQTGDIPRLFSQAPRRSRMKEMLEAPGCHGPDASFASLASAHVVENRGCPEVMGWTPPDGI